MPSSESGAQPAAAEQPGPRVRIAFEVSEDTAAAYRVEAAKLGISLAELARQAMAEKLDRLVEESEEALFAKPPRDTKARKQERFLRALERRFFVVGACRLAKVDRREVKGWLEDEEFGELFTEAKEAFIESVERKLLRVGAGKLKGQVIALLSFLNAHHPSYGRLRVEQITRLLGPLIESFYDVIREMAGDKLGDAIVKRLRELAEKKLANYSD